MRPIRSPPNTSTHFSFLRKVSDSSMILKGRHSIRDRSRPSMPPRVYRVRRIRSLIKPRVSPVCCRVSGALGASGSPPVSQSRPLRLICCTSFIPLLRSFVEAGLPRLSQLAHHDEQGDAHGRHTELHDARTGAAAGKPFSNAPASGQNDRDRRSIANHNRRFCSRDRFGTEGRRTTQKEYTDQNKQPTAVHRHGADLKLSGPLAASHYPRETLRSVNTMNCQP